MFDNDSGVTPHLNRISHWVAELSSVCLPTDDAAMIDELRDLEVLVCKARSRQAALSVVFDASQRRQQAARRVPAARQGRGVAEQIALARRESPHRAKRHLSMAKILHAELPHTRAAFAGGHITEWKALIITRETACLTIEDRLEVDRRIAGDPARIEAMGDRELEARVRELAYELDARSWVQRRARAEADRRVTCRPAPDVMTHVSALLPVKQGVAVYASLRAAADRLTADGDPRSRGQIMADTLYQRVVAAASSKDAHVRITINVVVPDPVLPAVPARHTSRATARSPATSPESWPATPTPSSPCVGSMPSPKRASSWPWTLAPGRSRRLSPRSSGCGTRSAAPRGATRRSATETTSRPWMRTVRPPRPTVKGSAKAATMPSRRSAGELGRDQVHGTPSRRPLLLGIGTDHERPRSAWLNSPADSRSHEA